MDFKITIDLDELANDGWFRSDDFLASVQSNVEGEVARDIINHFYQDKGYYGNKELKEYIASAIQRNMDKVFTNADIIKEIKDKVVDQISEKVAARKVLAQSQFDLPQFASLTTLNKSYLLELVDECIAKKFKGV